MKKLINFLLATTIGLSFGFKSYSQQITTEEYIRDGRKYIHKTKYWSNGSISESVESFPILINNNITNNFSKQNTANNQNTNLNNTNNSYPPQQKNNISVDDVITGATIIVGGILLINEIIQSRKNKYNTQVDENPKNNYKPTEEQPKKEIPEYVKNYGKNWWNEEMVNQTIKGEEESRLMDSIMESRGLGKWWEEQSKEAENIWGESGNEVERTKKTISYVIGKEIPGGTEAMELDCVANKDFKTWWEEQTEKSKVIFSDTTNRAGSMFDENDGIATPEKKYQRDMKTGLYTVGENFPGTNKLIEVIETGIKKENWWEEQSKKADELYLPAETKLQKHVNTAVYEGAGLVPGGRVATGVIVNTGKKIINWWDK